MTLRPPITYKVATIVALLFGWSACSKADSTPARVTDAGDVGTADVRNADIGPDAPSCVTLFGVPGERTGLGPEQCGPSCGCDAVVAHQYADAEVEGWLQWELETPFDEVVEDPYAGPEPPAPSGDVCALSFDAAAGTYRAETRAEVGDDAMLTHGGPCGVCSTLQDLAAYVRNPDLTGPVRECGLLGIREGQDANIGCLEDLGFTRPCAQIWYFNTVHTRTECLAPCFQLIDAPYHTPDGGLNECLACDETSSGPVFKYVAGRTRRNSGLASAICRPCDSVTAVSHDYPTR